MYILKILIFLQLFFLVISNQNINPSARTGPQDLLVTHYDCEENILHKYAINQVSQCETEPQAIENYKCNSGHFIQKPEQQQSQDINSQQHFLKRKYIVHKSQMEIKTDLTTNHSTRVISNDFYISTPKIVKTSYSD